VVPPDVDVGMVGAKRGLGDGEREFVLGEGADQIPLVVQDQPEVVPPDADVRVVGTEGGLGDGEREFLLGACRGQVPLCP